MPSDAARRHLTEADAWGLGHLPVCVANPRYSLTDTPQVRGVPADFRIHFRDAEVRSGAGFVVALAADRVTMPALPARPNA